MQKEEDFILDLRKATCWKYYTDPKSDTFGNGRGSALKAGYAPSYANVITTEPWFKHKLLKLNLVSKAEKALDKALDMETANAEGFEQADLMRVQTDVAKFIAKTLGKDEGYSERTELTGKNGEAIVFMPAELMDKYGLSEPEKTVEEQNKGI